jgi:hypothetical protein
MPKRPGFTWYPDDWMNDIGLRQCSAAARGIWIDLLSLMHQGEPYGHLSSRKGDLSLSFISRTCGLELSELGAALIELEANDVFSRTSSGVIFSRKMVRDEDLRLRRAAGGKKSQDNPNVPRPKEERISFNGTYKDIHDVPSLNSADVPTNTTTNTESLDSKKENLPSGPHEEIPEFETHSHYVELTKDWPDRTGLTLGERIYIDRIDVSADPELEHANLMAAKSRWMASEKWHFGYVKNPAKWLAEGQFNDDPEPCKCGGCEPKKCALGRSRAAPSRPKSRHELVMEEAQQILKERERERQQSSKAT